MENRERKVGREIIHVASAYMNTEKIIMASDGGQKRPQCLYLKQHTHTHVYRSTHFLSLLLLAEVKGILGCLAVSRAC